jgi:hypothetical protein
MIIVTVMKIARDVLAEALELRRELLKRYDLVDNG